MPKFTVTDALGLRWQYDGPAMICGAPPVLGTGGGEGAGAGTGAGASSGQPTTTPSATTPPPTPTIDWETVPAHFRDEYNRLKSSHDTLQTEHKTYKDLGEPGDLERGYTVANRIYQEMHILATAQGYKQEEIDEAFDKDPVSALRFLREEADRRAKQGTASKTIAWFFGELRFGAGYLLMVALVYVSSRFDGWIFGTTRAITLGDLMAFICLPPQRNLWVQNWRK